MTTATSTWNQVIPSRRGHVDKQGAFISDKGGNINIHKSAADFLGDAERVELLTDSEHRQFALRPRPSNSHTSYMLRTSNKGIIQIGGAAAVRTALNLSGPSEFKVSSDGDLVVFTLIDGDGE